MNSTDKQLGYRLHYMELLNWGTFNGQIWSIHPDGENSLLTGAVGSGKSTVVDALTCLLVPHNKIVFNKAAGAESKERSLTSYVKGNYSAKSDELLNAGKAVSLRYKNPQDATYTVILANFHNEGYHTDVSLAQLFWIENGSLRKQLFIASQPLSIQEHFSGFNDVKALKKRFRSLEYIELFEDNFSKYSQRFRQLFGMNSDKAIDLFYQTVSMKSVSSLTEFVRNQMLETSNIQEQIEELKRRFDDLHQAHAAVVEARKQRDMLKPLESLEQDFKEVIARLEETDVLISSAIPAYFAEKKYTLVQEDIADCQRRLLKLEAQITQAEQELDECRDKIGNLKYAIRENGGDRIEQIEGEIRQYKEEERKKKENHTDYLRLAGACELPAARTEQSFYGNKKLIENGLEQLKEEIERHNQELGELAARHAQTQKDMDAQQEEIISLRQRTNQLPSSMLEIRSQIAESLGISETEIPFAGELLKVRNAEKEWEGALERLLHGFALSMLVPDAYYPQVSGFINANRLMDKNQKGVRLEYFRIPQGQKLQTGQLEDLHPNSAVFKLEIKPDTPFRNWLEKELVHRFDLKCVSLEEFQQVSDGITKEGQIKTGRIRHVKDDRRDLWDRRNFVLGWNNHDKIKAIEMYLTKLKEQSSQEDTAIAEKRNQVRTLSDRQTAFQRLNLLKDWNELDWQRISEQIALLEQEKKQLSESNDTMKTLQEQLAQAKTEEERLRTDCDKKKDERGGYRRQVANHENLLPSLKEELNRFPEEKKTVYYPLIDEILQQQNYSPSIHNIDRMKTDISNRQSGIRMNLQKKSDSLYGKVLKVIKDYRSAFPSEVLEIPEEVEATGEYVAKLHQIEREGLPAHEARLKEMLNTTTINDICTFDNKLDMHAKQIQEKIAIINKHLEAIEFNKGTYIRIQTVNSQDPEIIRFKADLKACYSNLLNAGDTYTEERFEQVQHILDRFRSNENRDIEWTAKVTDVRRWFLFNASERYRSDDSEKEFYAGTSGKSGGQKEKLAYTILASALAYQFGLNYEEEKSKSFRFVVIDEAFGRGDDESTQFGLDLFKRLNLQLLIVTPLQKIHVIENYIRSVHYVSNPGGADSQIRNLSIEEYKSEKENYQNLIQIEPLV